MYNPKIYIRDYGVPTRRVLAFSAAYDLDWFDAALKRALLMHAESPVVGEEFLLFEGDMQTGGGDVLGLSGSGNDLLVLTNDASIRFFGSDVALQYSNISGFPSWSYDLVAPGADVRRDLIVRVDVAAFSQTMGQADLLRGVLVTADAGSYATSGYAVDLKRGNILSAEVADFTVTAPGAGLLRSLPMSAATASFAWSGVDAYLARSLLMAASGASFTLTFIDANPSTDSIEALSGDANTGGDLTLLSGDAQSGSDFLLISQ